MVSPRCSRPRRCGASSARFSSRTLEPALAAGVRVTAAQLTPSILHVIRTGIDRLGHYDQTLVVLPLPCAMCCGSDGGPEKSEAHTDVTTSLARIIEERVAASGNPKEPFDLRPQRDVVNRRVWRERMRRIMRIGTLLTGEMVVAAASLALALVAADAGRSALDWLDLLPMVVLWHRWPGCLSDLRAGRRATVLSAFRRGWPDGSGSIRIPLASFIRTSSWSSRSICSSPCSWPAATRPCESRRAAHPRHLSKGNRTSADAHHSRAGGGLEYPSSPRPSVTTDRRGW